jgi:hypothetical protein
MEEQRSQGIFAFRRHHQLSYAGIKGCPDWHASG